MFEESKQFHITPTSVVVGEVQPGEHKDVTIQQITVDVIEVDCWNHLAIYEFTSPFSTHPILLEFGPLLY